MFHPGAIRAAGRSSEPPGLAEWTLVLLLPLVLFLVPALWVAKNVPFPAPIDEAQHLAFILDMQRTPVLFPDHSRMTVPRAVSGEPAEANYLNHPSPYYHALAQVAVDAPAASKASRLRLVNIALATIGVLLLAAAGAILLPSLASRLGFGVVLTMFPKLALISGLINNDSLGLVATGTTMLGMALFARRPAMATAVLWGAGLALGGWTKLTVLVMLGCASGITLLLLWAAGRARHWGHLFALGVTGSVGLIPTLASLHATGRVLWSSPTNNAVPEQLRPDLSVWEHHFIFFREIALKWPSLEPAGAAHLLGLAALVAVCLLFLVKGFRALVSGKTGSPAVAMALGLLLAWPITMIIHASYGWEAFQRIGDLTSAQPRYYYALWPGVALVLALLFDRLLALQTLNGRAKSLIALVSLALLLPSSSWLLIAAG